MVRTAQRALRSDEVVHEEAVLRHFGAPTAAELVDRALSNASPMWCDVSRRAGVRAALERLPGATERALRRADRAAARRFELFGHPVDFGLRAIDWAADPVSGHRYPLVPVEQLRLRVEGSDPKYPWALGRLDAAVALGQGYWAQTKEGERARYARAFVSLVTELLDANPVGHGVQWACPMEVALRAANVAQALLMFRDAPAAREPVFVLRVLTALADHSAYVEANLEDLGAVPNNHLVANWVGLMVVGVCFPELPNAARQVARATRGLRETMAAQVHADGVSFEGSIPYHRLALELFTLGHLAASAQGVDLGDRYVERLLRMFAVSRALCSERGYVAQLGDNDSGQALVLADRPPLDHGYLAPLGAAIFAAAELKGSEGETFPDEGAWLLGRSGLERYRRLKPGARVRAFSSREGGLHVLRGGGAVVTVSAGPQGQRGVGGHSHNDKLSFELHVDGVPVIVDPGTGTYTRDLAVRNRYRSTAAHNTVQVNGAEQNPIDPQRPFALVDRCDAQVTELDEGPEVDRLVATHRGYAQGPAPVLAQRAFILDKPGRSLCVRDLLEGQGMPSLVARLHLPDGQARLREATEAERARAQKAHSVSPGLGTSAVELGPPEAPRAVVLFQEGLDVALRASEYSPGYGERVDATCIEYRAEGPLPRWLTAVVLLPARTGLELDTRGHA
jgi:hypothetical protein